MAELTVLVRYNDFEISNAINVPVSSFYERQFDRIAVCDDPVMAYAAMEDTKVMAQPKFELREDVAKELADHIATALLEVMANNDTYNGYPIKKPQSEDQG